MKVTGILVSIFSILVGGAIWVLYPTAIQSNVATFESLPFDEFMKVRGSAENFARTVEAKGIQFHGGPEQATSFEFTCKGVPLLLVDNGRNVMFVHVMAQADHRAPDVQKFREAMYTRLKSSGRPGGPAGPAPGPERFEAFVLKHRDGIDVSQACR